MAASASDGTVSISVPSENTSFLGHFDGCSSFEDLTLFFLHISRLVPGFWAQSHVVVFDSSFKSCQLGLSIFCFMYLFTNTDGLPFY